MMNSKIRRNTRDILLGVLALCVFFISLQGVRAMLSGYKDSEQIPMVELIRSVTIPSEFRVDAQDIRARLQLNGDSMLADVPKANVPVLGSVDRFEEDSSGSLRVTGWAVPGNSQRPVVSIGLLIDRKIALLKDPTLPRPDVEAALQRAIKAPGFSILLKLPKDVSKCDVKVVVFYEDLTFNEMQLPLSSGCL
jgi:hypothetical protein